MRWTAPKNISQLIAADPEQTWQDDQFEPLLITAMGGTLMGERPVPLVWQIEFEPAAFDDAPGKERVLALGHDDDGYGWTALILSAFVRRYPASAPFVRSDEELATCVICAEQTDVFEQLVEVALDTVAGAEGPDD